MSTLILFRTLKNKFHSKERFRDSYVILLHTYVFHTTLSYILSGQWSQQSIYVQLSHVNYWLRPTDSREQKPKALTTFSFITYYNYHHVHHIHHIFLICSIHNTTVLSFFFDESRTKLSSDLIPFAPQGNFL
jgi:hypothetical protein